MQSGKKIKYSQFMFNSPEKTTGISKQVNENYSLDFRMPLQKSP